MLVNVNFGRECSCFRFGFHKGAIYFCNRTFNKEQLCLYKKV